MGEVQIAKKDVVAEVDEGHGVKVKRKVAIKGQPVDPAFADLVGKGDVSDEVTKTRSTTDRRRAADEAEPEEVDHDDVRATAASPAEIKRRTRAKNKARSTKQTKSDDDEK